MKNVFAPFFTALVVFLFLYFFVWQWVICRVYISPDEVMYISAKTGAENPDPEVNRVVDPNIKGVQKKIYGEGRYFINPILNDRTIRKASVYISPKEVGVVQSLSGEELPQGKFLVKAGENNKGMLQSPLTPGKWRVNPMAYKIEKRSYLKIAPGFVGCVTALAGNPAKGKLALKGEQGIRKDVLQPGIYYLNTKAFKVDIVEVGYHQTLFSNINFTSKDGFNISVDVSIVWGLLPEKVPSIIEELGNVEDVSKKIIQPQVDSLCRIEGSKYGAVELIQGISREKFQKTFTKKLISLSEEKNIKVLHGLVREINVPLDIRQRIQKAKIAAEELETKKEESATQTIQNQLEKLKQEVEKGVRGVRAGTERDVANIHAKGEKEVAKIRALQQVEVAKLQKELAVVQAKTTRILGKAKADAIEFKKRAEADKIVQAIKAVGGPAAYSNYIFAQNLPFDLKIFIRYSGDGTFWTDLPKGMKNIEKLAAYKIMKGRK